MAAKVCGVMRRRRCLSDSRRHEDVPGVPDLTFIGHLEVRKAVVWFGVGGGTVSREGCRARTPAAGRRGMREASGYSVVRWMAEQAQRTRCVGDRRVGVRKEYSKDE